MHKNKTEQSAISSDLPENIEIQKLLKEMSPGNVILVSQILQCASIIIIIILTVILNISIIIHISKCSVKNKVNSYVLTKHLCIVDLLGGVLILPLPLIATWNGK